MEGLELSVTQAHAFGFEYQEGPHNVQDVTLAAANTAIGIGDPITGDSNGLGDQSDGGQTQIRGIALNAAEASSGDTIQMIETYPSTVFAVRLGGTPAVTVIGNTTDITPAARDGDTLESRCELNSTTGTGSANFKIKGLYKRVGNAFGDANVIVTGTFYETFHGVEDPDGV